MFLKANLKTISIPIIPLLITVGILALAAIIFVIIKLCSKKKTDNAENKQEEQPSEDTVQPETPTQDMFPVYSASVIRGIKNGKAPEDAVITYILTQAVQDKIKMAFKENDYYICFTNEQLSHFFKRWFAQLKMHESGYLDKEDYSAFIKAHLEKNEVMEKTGIDKLIEDMQNSDKK